MTNTSADRQAALDRQATSSGAKATADDANDAAGGLNAAVGGFNTAAGGARALLAVALITSLFRLWFAWRLPITGDEAYFFYWGINPDWGFYDHPPMVGWWLAALSALSHEPFWLRLPALLLPLILAWIAYRIVRVQAPAAAYAAATLVLLLPLNAWNVAITTDIPLIVFAALTLWAYLRALQSDRALDYALCGLALGGALLSKYFAGILALAIASHFLMQLKLTRPKLTGPKLTRPKLPRPTGARLRGLVWIVVFSLPAALIQIGWNAQNCWPNVMFNLVNRHEGAGLSWRTPLLYLATVVYVLTPWVLYWLFKRPQAVEKKLQAVEKSPPAVELKQRVQQSALAWIALFAFLVFLALSLVKTIGLHWVASFVLPGLLWFVLRASATQRQRAMYWGSAFALLHYLVIIIALTVPLETYQSWRNYPGLVMTLDPKGFEQALEPYRGPPQQRLALASDGYSPAVTIGFNLRQYAFVFGPGSSHARHDDILTDARQLAGKDILIVRRDPLAGADDARYFERTVVKQVSVRGAAFYLTQGFGFKYEPYRDAVLDQVRQRYYAVPRWLPAGPCYFCDRYFTDRACHR